MVYLRIKTVWMLVVLALLAGGGCGPKPQQKEVVYHSPLLDPNFAAPAWAAEAVRRAGGKDAWTKTTGFEIDSVITFYRPDVYLTQRAVEVRVWPSSIRIAGTEQSGDFGYELSGQGLVVSKGKASFEVLPQEMSLESFSLGLLDIMIGPIRVLDRRIGEFARSDSTVRISGIPYYMIGRQNRTDNFAAASGFCASVFYQGMESLLIDKVLIECRLGGGEGVQYITVHGYDYHEFAEGGIRVPAKIEVYSSDSQGNLRRLLAEIYCQRITAM